MTPNGPKPAARSPKPPLRGLTLIATQRAAGSLAALFAFAGCAVSGELSLALLVLFPVALVVAHRFGDRFYDRANWAWTTLIIGAFGVYAALVVSGRLDIVLAAAEFVLLLCLHRLLHRRTERDEHLLLLLSLLLLCAGAALSAELTYGFAFLAFSVTATWAMALTHVRFEIEAGRGPQGSAVLLQSRRIATPALLGALAALSMMGLVGAAVIFFTFPRVTIGGLRRASHGTPAPGLGDRVDLSGHGTIADDPRVVLRVRLVPQPARQTLDQHWRARTFEVWTGHGWQASAGNPSPAVRLPRPPGLPGLPRMGLVNADLELVAGFTDGVVLTPGEWLLSLEFLRPLTASGVQPRLLQLPSGDLLYHPVDVGDLHYSVHADLEGPSAAQLRGRGQNYPPRLSAVLAVPANLDPRLAALAKQLGGGKDPLDAATAIEAWLSTQLAYTRELPGEVQDPIADFVFSRKKGHCELFSSTMVLMLRSLGVPARNVTGYYGGQLTSAGYYAVRAGDAHSWVEVYFPGVGFVQFDPTPATDRGSKLDTAWSRLVLVWDTVQQRWRALIVDYDLLAQAQAVKRIGALVTEAGRRLSGKAGTAPRLKAALTGIVTLFLAGLLVVALRRVRRGPKAGREASRLDADRQRALQLWQKARGTLRRAGIELNPATTAHEAARLARVPAAHELAHAYLAARWGTAPLPAERARTLLRNLSSELSGRRLEVTERSGLRPEARSPKPAARGPRPEA